MNGVLFNDMTKQGGGEDEEEVKNRKWALYFIVFVVTFKDVMVLVAATPNATIIN